MQSKTVLSLFLVFFSLNLVNAQVGNLLWSEEFDNLNNWIFENGNGSWGWGNGELQYYSQNNARIDAVPGEPGNNALVITAKAETGANIVDQWGNPLNYTSARLNTKSKVSIRYGMVETRVRVPDLDLGGWPAVWMLGTTNFGWPTKGELDIMEMGHSKAFRDLHDGHNGGTGMDNSTVNQMVAANAIFYDSVAVNPQNPTGAASIAWDPDDDYCRPYYDQSQGLHDRFLIYRMYWDTDSIFFTVEDNGTERNLYAGALPLGANTTEFNEPFFFIVNLAIGGALTDAYNLGDPASGSAVSMSLPAEMFVDYIKVYEWNNEGEVYFGPPQMKHGTFGIFTDSTQVDDQLNFGSDADIYVWEGTLNPGNEAPYEGPNVLSWTSNGLGWFGAGAFSYQPLNLSGFSNGHLNFSVKAPANMAFQIGVIDAWGNQHYVEFPANQTKFGLVRDGNWGQASIPIADLRGTLIDMRMLSYSFVVLETNGASGAIAFDDVYYSGGSGLGASEIPSSEISIYPNPARNALFISGFEQNESLSVRLIDQQGRVILEELSNFQEGHPFSVEGIAKGFYILQIETAKQNYSQQIILRD